MTIVCQNVLGHQARVKVNAHSEGRAMTAALRKIEREHPGEGWRALRVDVSAGAIQ
jgi:hypothetical protein